MTTFVGKGTDIARALDNALLFCDPKAEYLPGVVHVEFSAGGIAFSACDDYATGRDRVGEVTLSTADGLYAMHETDTDALVKFTRSAKTKAVTLSVEANTDLVAVVGDEEARYPLYEPAEAWADILPLIDVDVHKCTAPDPSYCEECASATSLPNTVAFNAARFARFGRVKAVKDAPMDVRFLATEGAPVALVRVGPTFRGELQGVRRAEALKHLGEGGEACFWPA